MYYTEPRDDDNDNGLFFVFQETVKLISVTNHFHEFKIRIDRRKCFLFHSQMWRISILIGVIDVWEISSATIVWLEWAKAHHNYCITNFGGFIRNESISQHSIEYFEFRNDIRYRTRDRASCTIEFKFNGIMHLVMGYAECIRRHSHIPIHICTQSIEKWLQINFYDGNSCFFSFCYHAEATICS